MIRAVFFDLDGTLLSSGKKILPPTQAALRRLNEQGVCVFFATARSPRLKETLHFTDEVLNLFRGGICANGASIVLDGKIEHQYLDAEIARQCLQAADAFAGVHVSLHLPDGLYAFNFTPDASMQQSWKIDASAILPPDAAYGRAVKMMLFYDRLHDAHCPLPEALAQKILSVCAGRAKAYITDGGKSMQIISDRAGKWQAIQTILKKFGWTCEQIAVFGDDENDLEMLRACRHSVAMGNASDTVRQAAVYVTRTNDAGGIEYALSQLLRLI